MPTHEAGGSHCRIAEPTCDLAAELKRGLPLCQLGSNGWADARTSCGNQRRYISTDGCLPAQMNGNSRMCYFIFDLH